MAKELPYFQFEPAKWMMGKIQRCSKEVKGAFMDLCSRYWNNECNYLIEDAQLDCGKVEVDLLIKNKIVKKSGENIKIDFLDIQFSNCLDTSDKRRKAARVRWDNKDASAMQVHKGAMQTDAEEKREEEKREYKIPTYEEFNSYAINKKPNIDSSVLRLKYDAWIENDWKDGNQSPIKNWKVKLLNTLPHVKEKEITNEINYMDTRL